MELWLAFVAAAALVLMVPGPTVITVVGFSIAQGRRVACLLAITVALAHATILSLSAAGLGAVLDRNPASLIALQICGAAYMVYVMVSMASRLWKRRQRNDDTRQAHLAGHSQLGAVRHTFFVTLLNPNTLFFFAALLPQFVTSKGSATEQLLIMSLTFVGLSMINSAVYGLSAATATKKTGITTT